MGFQLEQKLMTLNDLERSNAYAVTGMVDIWLVFVSSIVV